MPVGSAAGQQIDFTPSPDVACLLHALLDRIEQRLRRGAAAETSAARSIKVRLADLDLPGYFSQADPEPRLVANRQLQELARLGLLSLDWQPGESGHLLDAVVLPAGAILLPAEAPLIPTPPRSNEEGGSGAAAALYTLLQRQPLSDRRDRLEMLLLADRFRFPAGDWRGRALRYILDQLHSARSPAPFSLSDMEWNLDLLAVLSALTTLETETPYRVFSVSLFNDSKRFETLKPALVRLARRGNPAWKSLPVEEVLRELNLVANPAYIHLAGGWQLITRQGELLSLGGFTPTVGFPAAQTAAVQALNVQALAVLCIENLTTFHEAARAQEGGPSPFALLCILGNPSPATRRLLRLVPEDTPIYLWSDLDYGGFNILSQLRQQVDRRIQPYRMGIADFDAYAHLARPLTQNDARQLKRLCLRPELKDVRPVIEHLLKCGLKLEQEAFDILK